MVPKFTVGDLEDLKTQYSEGRNALILLARAPELGKVKTRIATEVGAEKALHVYTRLLKNIVSSMSDLEKSVRKIIAWTKVPDNTGDYQDWEHWLQPEVDLGDCMQWAIHNSVALGAEKAIIVGADIPDISQDRIERAFDTLDYTDVVLGPAADGGYYLVGAKRDIPELFPDINWGGTDVLDKTTESLQKTGISFQLLDILSDIDHWEDWVEWSGRIKKYTES